MSKVYFSKNFEKILSQINLDALGNNVAIKVHFGERGCNTYINPALVEKVYGHIISRCKLATLVECNVLYKGSRTNRADHIKTAREHGFNLPIDILDGEVGNDFIEVDGCKIGRGIKNYDSLIVLSHFKGHVAAGFGGALKNIGMGLGSRAGKLHMHSNVKPIIGENCIGCEACIKNCNAKAISLIDNRAKIDEEKCEGCAMCIAVCPTGAADVPWAGRTAQDLQEKIAEYTAAVLSLFKQRAIFINVLENITEHCDCMGMEQSPFMPDVGIVYSDDVVATDKASLDLVDKFSGGKFNSINSIDKLKQISCAENLGLGSSEYELIEL